ncbi:MAG: protein BatD, partial [Deltaproteobacteria bacterium]|nr:protein BatD [Deltaproteobacteria bacterium]
RRSFFDDSFFGFSETVPRVFTTKPITVMVQPLPAADKPRGFGGLVGNFMLASELSSRKLEVGESLTLTLTLRGSGNLKNNQEISVPKLDNFKVYDDKPVFEQSVSGTTVEGRLVIKKALVPLVEGKLTIPKIDVSFLNPETSRYVTVSTGPNVIDVAPASVKEQFQAVDAVQATGAQEAVRIIGHDILPVHTAIAVLSPARYRPSLLLVCGGLIVPVLIWVAVLLSLAVRRRNRSDQGLVRAKGAYGQFRKKMTEAGLALKQDDKRFYQLAPKALKEFVGDKLNIAGSALTADDLEKRLADRGVPAETIAELKECIDFFEAAQYGSSSHSAEEGQAVFNTIQEAAAVLNKKMKRKSVISDR